MRKIFTLVFFTTTLLMGASLVCAQESAKVMLLGTFHFSSPGLDKVKTTHLDITSEASQHYLQNFSQRLAKGFTPTKVLVECSASFQSELSAKYQLYLKGDFALPVNEIYQLGFRVAKASGVSEVLCFDERDIQWQAEPLFAQMPAKAPAIQAAFDTLIAQVTEQGNQMHQTLSIGGVLQAMNTTEQFRLNQSIYLLTNEVGAGDTFVGADAAASWWHRNFRMYANIQKAARQGERALVIGGQGHIAVIRDFLANDTERQAVSVTSYL